MQRSASDKRMPLRRSAARSAPLVAIALLLAACGAERAPISHVQPNVLDKSFFVGADLASADDDPEFYALATLVDVGYGAVEGLFASSWTQRTSRIRWDIQEDVLLARLAYERIEGTDGKGLGRAVNDGLIVGAWRIESHFDIQRQYNPTTGEEMNVVVENTTDRPWHQRSYMRVDWSKNLNVGAYDFDTLAQMDIWGVDYEPLAYSISDPTHPDAPRFEIEEGYFDVTNKALATPQEVRFSWGSVPACFLTSSPETAAFSCNATEITVRHAFRRVVDTDYEPVHWDGLKFSAAGAFTNQRQGYARNYGSVDDRWYRFASRYNIWERSHWYEDPEAMTGEVACFTPETTPPGKDPNRDENGDGTADECAAVGRGSRCDTFKQRCTLPYRDRVVKPVVLHYTQDSDYEYFEPTEWAAHEWDVAMRSAVMAARYTECVRTGGADCATTYPVLAGQQRDHDDAIWLAREVDACRRGIAWEGEDCDALARRLGEERDFSEGAIATALMDEVVVLCHSPVEAGDPAACGERRLPADLSAVACQQARFDGDRETMKRCDRALSVRLGDLRYHQVTTIREAQVYSPWGIMVDADDPLSGEKIAASVNVWSHATDRWSQAVVDTVRYARGELSTEEVTEGEYILDWARAAEAAASSGSLPTFTAAEREARVAAFAQVDATRLRAAREAAAQHSSMRDTMESIASEMASFRADAHAATTSLPLYEARREAVVGTPIEAALMTPAMQELAGRGLGATEAAELASPLRGGNPLLQRELRQRREAMIASRGACILESEAAAPFGIVALGDILEAKFGPLDENASLAEELERAERMRRYVANRAHFNVVIHEMGHSFGLRHNFVSSSDAFSYRPQYWQLRTSDGEAKQPCTDLDPTGACVGPRYFDPMTEEESDNLIHMFMQSSVMEYSGEKTQDFLGLGAYDFHATRMIYGDVATVFADQSFRVRTPRGSGMLERVDNFGGIVGIQPSIGRPSDPIATDNIHYSQLQRAFELISSCEQVDPELFRPSTWDEATMGAWHPTLDGLLVEVDGRTTRCRQQPVDFVSWNDLRRPRSAEEVGRAEADVIWAQAGPAIDPAGRIRVPYGFASDNWADLGNLAVYRHDNGADPYELFDFLITQQEVAHIFDNYRRNRSDFTVRSTAFQTLSRYNEKLRDAAKGLALIANVNKDRALTLGYEPESYWAAVADIYYGDNVLAAGIGFDHFARMLARPEAGPHYLPSRPGSILPSEDRILRSAQDPVGVVNRVILQIPNGATGRYGDVSYGGRPVENAYAPDSKAGDYRSEFVVNVGSYYEKAFTAFLMTESYDNFISSRRSDFTDARYRSVSMADMFPDAFRRWLGNNLTGDDFVKGPRVLANGNMPRKDEDGFPEGGIGWIDWRAPAGPRACFQQGESLLCDDEGADGDVLVLDPQVGWEQQKFLIAWTLWFLPENAKQHWLDQLRVWELGADADPGFANRIEFHDPAGKVYVAKTFGREEVFGKQVQKGIAARMLEYANDLVAGAYVTEAIDADGDGITDWYEPTPGPNGLPLVRYDPAIRFIDEDGFELPDGIPGCNETENWACVCSANRACVELRRFTELPFFLREAITAYGHGSPRLK